MCGRELGRGGAVGRCGCSEAHSGRKNSSPQQVIGGRVEMKEILVEYEWNKGSVPSGYAKIKLLYQIQGYSHHRPRQDLVSENIRWHIRDTDFARKQSPETTSEDIPSFISMAISGIQQGINDIIQDQSELKSLQLNVLIEEITFDLIYSTQHAFRLATRCATKDFASWLNKP